MSRGDRRGSHGAKGRGGRAPGGHRPRAGGDPAADYDPNEHSWANTGPPWEQPGWDDTSGTLPRALPANPAPGHPSGPLPPLLPADSGALPPLPPLPPERGRRAARSAPGGQAYPASPENPRHAGGPAYPDPGRDGRGGSGRDYPAGGRYPAGGGYPRDDVRGQQGAAPPRDGFPQEAYPGAGRRGRPGSGTGYPGGEVFAEDDAYPEDEAYPEDDAYPGGGYEEDGYPDEDGYGYGDDDYGYPGYEAAGDYPEAGGYPGAAGGPGHGMGPGRSGHDDEDDGYPDDEDWYGDEYQEEFLPGMTGEGGGSRRGDGRRGGGRRGGAPAPRGGDGRAPRQRRMRRLAPWLALSVVLALVGGAGGVGYYYWSKYLHPPDYSGEGTGSVIVQIKPGDTAAAVGLRLQELGVVESARAFSNAAKASSEGKSLEPGYYRVHKHMQASLALALLLKPSSRVQTRVTIREGLRVSEIISILGKATKNQAGYEAAIKNVRALHLPSFAKDNPEGYLFPATYDIQPGTSPIKVLQAMVTRFDQEAANIHLPVVAAHGELTQAQVIIVASLIEAEGRRLQDYPKIARVIYNRLNAFPAMKLQLDSTVMYALHTYGILASNRQLQVKSPYNTYLHTGLPPGPIECPGDAAIQAALHPAKGDWYYFVTVNPKTGLTKFTNDPVVFQQLRAELQKNLGQG